MFYVLGTLLVPRNLFYIFYVLGNVPKIPNPGGIFVILIFEVEIFFGSIPLPKGPPCPAGLDLVISGDNIRVL